MWHHLLSFKKCHINYDVSLANICVHSTELSWVPGWYGLVGRQGEQNPVDFLIKGDEKKWWNGHHVAKNGPFRTTKSETRFISPKETVLSSLGNFWPFITNSNDSVGNYTKYRVPRKLTVFVCVGGFFGGNLPKNCLKLIRYLFKVTWCFYLVFMIMKFACF